MLWSTIDLERVTNALRSHGQGVDAELLHYLSPQRWKHINLTGDYLRNVSMTLRHRCTLIW